MISFPIQPKSLYNKDFEFNIMERLRIETLRKLQNPTRSDSSTDNGHHSTPTNSTALGGLHVI